MHVDPAADDPIADVDPVEVGVAYFELHHQMRRVVDRIMSDAGLSLARAKVLMRIAADGPMNQARLAGLLGFAPRSVTETVDALERDGLVTRTEDPQDRRARIVVLTTSGHAAQQTAQTARAKALSEVFGSLSAADRRHFLELLHTLKSSFASGDTRS